MGTDSHTTNRSESMSDELPGMLATAKGVAKQEFPHTMDAQVWAEEFVKTYPMLHLEGVEVADVKGVMFGWFANAIMAGYDTANARLSETRRTYEDGLEDAAKVCRTKGDAAIERARNAEKWNSRDQLLYATCQDGIARAHWENADAIRALKNAAPESRADRVGLDTPRAASSDTAPAAASSASCAERRMEEFIRISVVGRGDVPMDIRKAAEQIVEGKR